MNKKQGFNLFDLFALGFGAIIGVGWSITIHRFFILGGGAIPAALGFIISMIMFVPVALVFAELSSAIPVAGGVVAYAKRTYGSKMAFMAGWFLSMSYLIILPFETISITEVLANILPFLKEGPVLYSLAGADIRLYAIITGIVLGFIIILINRQGTAAIARFQTILTLFLIFSALLTIILCLFKADVNNLSPIYTPMEGKTHHSLLTGILGVCAITPQYFSGFDTIPQSIEDAKDIEKKKIGRIVVTTLAAAGIFYGIIIISASLSYPWQLILNFDIPVLSNLMLTIYPGIVGKIMYWITILGALAGLFTTWNSFYVAGSRLLMSLGREGFIPSFFAVEKNNRPVNANIFCAFIMLIGPFLGIGVIDVLSTIGSFGFTVGWLIASLSFLLLRKKEPLLERPYKLKNYKFCGYASVFICLLMMVNCVMPFMPGYMGNIGLTGIIIWLLIGLIFYITSKKLRT